LNFNFGNLDWVAKLNTNPRFTVIEGAKGICRLRINQIVKIVGRLRHNAAWLELVPVLSQKCNRSVSDVLSSRDGYRVWAQQQFVQPVIRARGSDGTAKKINPRFQFVHLLVKI
jgi:hypothetical protein